MAEPDTAALAGRDFLVREWKAKAEEYRQERDALAQRLADAERERDEWRKRWNNADADLREALAERERTYIAYSDSQEARRGLQARATRAEEALRDAEEDRRNLLLFLGDTRDAAARRDDPEMARIIGDVLAKFEAADLTPTEEPD